VVSNEKILQRTNSVQLSVFHMEHESHGNRKVNGAKVDQRQHGEELWNKKEINLDGSLGMKPEELRDLWQNEPNGGGE